MVPRDPVILCVDDEPAVLEGLGLHLRRRYELLTASSGAKGLETLRQHPHTAVVVSDMRMPGMDGASFLGRARQIAPDAVRMLLTGQADTASAIAAVNEGQIFRFLVKPCSPSLLVASIEASLTQHRLLTAERVLLEQTLNGCIKALTDILALASPVSFGRAQRIKQYAADIARHLGLPDRWQIEVAAMISQLGSITLPAETVQKWYGGEELTDEEQEMVASVPGVAADVLGGIPRLEAVRGMLAAFTPASRSIGASSDPEAIAIQRGANILRVAIEFDELESRGESASRAHATMRGRAGRYDTAALEALAATHVDRREREEIRELPLSALRVGMTLADDIRLVTGTILVARGHEVTERLVSRARNFPPGSIRQPIRVLIRHAGVPVGMS